MNRLTQVMLTLLLATTTLVNVPALADARRDGDAADPLRRAQYMIRQLSEEKSKLEAETTRLQAENQKLSSQIEEVQQQVDKTSGKLDQTQQRNDQLVARIKSDVEKFNDLLEKYRQTVAVLKDANYDNVHLLQAVTERNQWIDQCQDKNTKMYEANVELLDRYQHKSAWDSLKQDEPVTGIASVELENQVQDYRFKLDDLKVTRFQQSLNPQDYALQK